MRAGLGQDVSRIAFAVTGVVAMTYRFKRIQGNPSLKPGILTAPARL